MDKKWNLQDIKPAQKTNRPRPAQKRSLRDESVPIDRRPTATSARSAVDSSEETINIHVENGTKKKRRSVFLVSFVLVGIFAAIVIASFLLRGADIMVEPRFSEPNVNAVFTAYQTPQVGELAYEVLTLEAEGERQVSATGQQNVTEQATGVIEIFKSTPGTQRLIKNTRFESAAGRVYRITESVIVPGAVDGSAGSISAGVFADEAGEEYNAAAGSRFTIPGLESDADLFNAMYAENTEPITGGFDGQKFIIDEAELATAKQALQMELRDALLERLPNEKPAGFTSFDDATAFTYESLPAVEYGENLATIKEKAVLQVPLFKDADFAEYIAAATIPGYEGLPVRIDDTDVFTFSYTGATTSSSNIANNETLEFKLAGRPLIVWTYDAGKLKTDLLGVNRTALSQILQAYPGIVKATAEIRPFWQRAFPTNLNQIEIEEVVDKESSTTGE